MLLEKPTEIFKNKYYDINLALRTWLCTTVCSIGTIAILINNTKNGQSLMKEMNPLSIYRQLVKV